MSDGSQRRSRYLSHGIMGLPSVFVAGIWIALWLVWIPVGRHRLVGRARSVSRSVFSQPQSFSGELDPRDIIRLQRETDEIDAPFRAVISHYIGEPRYLERGPGLGTGEEAAVPYSSTLSGDLATRGGYAPGWREKPVFPKPVEHGAELLIQCSGHLKQYGFLLPGPISQALGSGKAAWQVVVYVETDDNGRVEHVFLDLGSDDPAVDQRVVNAVYRGRLETKGARCGGAVTLSFPGEDGEQVRGGVLDEH